MGMTESTSSKHASSDENHPVTLPWSMAHYWWDRGYKKNLEQVGLLDLGNVMGKIMPYSINPGFLLVFIIWPGELIICTMYIHRNFLDEIRTGAIWHETWLSSPQVGGLVEWQCQCSGD